MKIQLFTILSLTLCSLCTLYANELTSTKDGNKPGTKSSNQNLDVSLIANKTKNSEMIALNSSEAKANIDSESFSIVVNSNNKIDSINKKQLRLIFLGRIRHWSESNKKLNVYYLEATSSAGKSFLKSIMRMTPDKFYLYWTKKVFSGSSAPPTEIKSSSKLLQHIADNEGGIAIVQSSSLKNLPEGCKVIKLE